MIPPKRHMILVRWIRGSPGTTLSTTKMRFEPGTNSRLFMLVHVGEAIDESKGRREMRVNPAKHLGNGVVDLDEGKPMAYSEWRSR